MRCAQPAFAAGTSASWACAKGGADFRQAAGSGGAMIASANGLGSGAYTAVNSVLRFDSVIVELSCIRAAKLLHNLLQFFSQNGKNLISSFFPHGRNAIHK